MINEAELKDTLLSFATNNRMIYVALTSALNEIEALRETVRGLDPTFAEVMEHRRAQASQNGAELGQQIAAGYELIIERLKDGYVC
jgi:hypothetical protein